MTFFRRFLILLLGLALLAMPTLVREWGLQYNERAYTPPDVPALNLAATPAPTATPQAVGDPQFANNDTLRRGPVVVDFAHFSFLNPANLQPLADALADRGLGLRYWVSQVNTMALESSAQFPDQSEDLAVQLKEASALVVVSPFFMWTPQEIAVAERFVADGGRLLLASDPDINGDFPSLVNILAEPFGVVFNDDYLYDTSNNDGNYTFFFNEAVPVEGEAAAGTEALADAQIAFYGGRSIGGAVIPQLHSVATTLSSLRTGQNSFTTVGIGGVAGRGTAGRVLAISDFDVLSEAYRVRHDNQRMVDFVADFLSADQRNNTMADFPEYLGKEVALSYGAGLAIDANLLLQGAQIQQRLENTGRTLVLTNGHALTKPSNDGKDLIYLTDYTTAVSETTLLDDLGIQIITEAVTVTVPVQVTPVAPIKATKEPTKTTATPTATPTPAKETPQQTPEEDETATPTASDSAALQSLFATSTVTATDTVTTTDTVTPTVLPEITPTVEPKLTPTLLPKVTPTVLATTTRGLGTTDLVTATSTAIATTEPLTVTTPLSTSTALTATVEPQTRVEITTYLETAEGLRFLAPQTVLVAQSKRADGSLLLAVLGADRRGIDAGVTRLLANDFKDCVIGEALTFCSLPPQATSTRSSSTSTTSGSKGSDTSSSDTSKESDSGSGSGSGSGSDDGSDDGSEPQKTPTAGTGVLLIDDNRSAAEGETSEADLYLQTLIGTGHSVDLWSAKSQGSPTAADLAKYAWVIWSNASYADGRLSIEDMDLVFGYVRQGGRLTLSSRFPLPGIEDASTLRDVVVGDMADLVKGLPDEPITLSEEQNAANLSPLAADTSGVQIALRRGADSDDAEAPVLVVLTDATESDSNARFMIVGMALTGLAEETSSILINNMATWMMAE